ncbi:hypothetical protein CHS0354_042135 [Potamilus streckersoni]|uniref:F-box domain-containing protein n=1 Tax=Potamilus streckersoni TaxID=2493646 RepID=A0AAE0TNZ6_9BIVA|nr:hypothetical protein CHS0354_042135 [Potamilus streckersoni]
MADSIYDTCYCKYFNRFYSLCPKHRLMAQMEATPETDLEEDPDYGWVNLPDIILEDVFTLLYPKERHQASMVCHHWYQAFYSPRAWETFILKGRVLTKKKFHPMKGWVREVCPRKTQVCLQKLGFLFKRIIIAPTGDFYSLHVFLSILDSFLEMKPLPVLNTFHFTFACESRSHAGKNVFGTGGKILEEITSLISRIKGLKNLTLRQLLLDVCDSVDMLEPALQSSAETLTRLELINCSKIKHPMPGIAQFENLQCLVITPQHLDDEIVLLLAGMGLLDLRIVQDQYTCDAEHVSAEAWRLVKEAAPFMKVTLEVRDLCTDKLLLQPHAPVHRIIFSSPYSLVAEEDILSVIHYYHQTLHTFAQVGWPRKHGSRSFYNRGDTILVSLIRGCPKLRTLSIRERISTATLLILATEGRGLRKLLVRQNALLKKRDWPKQSEWSNSFYDWLKVTSRSYDLVNKEVTNIIGYPWRPLRDEEFKWLRV